MPTQKPINQTLHGYLFAFITMIIWGSFSLLSRLSMHWGIDIWDLLAFRFGLSALAISLVLFYQNHWRFLLCRQSLMIAIFGSLGYCLAVYGGYYLAPVAHGIVLLNGLFPIVTAILAFIFLKQRFDIHTKISLSIVLVVFLGLFVMMIRQNQSLGLGDMLFVISALFFGTFSTLLKRYKFTATEVMASLAIWSAIIYLPLYWLFATPSFYNIYLPHLAIQASFHAFFVVIVATMTYTRAVQILGLIPAGTIANIAPFLATVVAVPLLNEPLNGMMIFGLIGMAIGALQPWRLVYSS